MQLQEWSKREMRRLEVDQEYAAGDQRGEAKQEIERIINEIKFMKMKDQ